jgi:hypothetical protein
LSCIARCERFSISVPVASPAFNQPVEVAIRNGDLHCVSVNFDSQWLSVCLPSCPKTLSVVESAGALDLGSRVDSTWIQRCWLPFAPRVRPVRRGLLSVVDVHELVCVSTLITDLPWVVPVAAGVLPLLLPWARVAPVGRVHGAKSTSSTLSTKEPCGPTNACSCSCLLRSRPCPWCSPSSRAGVSSRHPLGPQESSSLPAAFSFHLSTPGSRS